MDDPVRLLLTNAAAAGLIALVAWAASRTIRRQAVVHGLWLLALVTARDAAHRAAAPGAGVAGPRADRPAAFAHRRPHPAGDRPGTPAEASSPTSPRVGRGAAALVTSVAGRRPLESRASRRLALTAARSVAPPSPTDPRPGWRAAAWLSLAAGALAISLLTAWRFARFGRLLDCARPAPDAVAERAAAPRRPRLGLRRVPPVLLVPARIPPMLWPHRGGPRLLLPAGLLPDLHGDELDALLAHELAHVRRRDHWVRLVEIAATALFWWYPVTWWARRALRRAEERCCDEWVLRLLPRSAEAYANGLLKSLTFVAARTAALPSVASGAGPVEDIEARLKEILMTRPVPRLAAPATPDPGRRRGPRPGRLPDARAVERDEGRAGRGGRRHPRRRRPPPATSTPKPRPGRLRPPGPPPRRTPRRGQPARPPSSPAKRASSCGVPGGVVGGVPGGVVGGVPGGVGGALAPVAARPGVTPRPALAPRPGLPPLAALTPLPALAPVAAPGPTPQAQPAPAPEPAIAARTRSSDPARRALEDQRRAIEDAAAAAAAAGARAAGKADRSGGQGRAGRPAGDGRPPPRRGTRGRGGPRREDRSS